MSQTTKAPGRNDPCHCGSGKKYKQCCLEKDDAALREARAKAAAKAEKKAAKNESAAKQSREKDTGGPQGNRAVPHQPPKASSNQPWKKAQSNTHPTQRSLPRKAGKG